MKTAFIGVNLSEEEKNIIIAASQKKNMKIAPYIRLVSLENARRDLQNVQV